jgi:hypothetical protein
LSQVVGELIGGVKGVGMVLAEDPAAAVQGVLLKVAGLLVLAELA